jgi:hypothetical protein
MELSLGVEPIGTRESWVRLPGRETLFALFYDEGFMRDVVRNDPSEAEDEARSAGATCGADMQCALVVLVCLGFQCPPLDASVMEALWSF